MRAPLALLIAGVTTGCLHITSASKSEEKVTGSTTTTVKLPPRHEVSAASSGFDLLFTASKAEPCRDEVTESVSVIESVEKRLPPTHWAILGGGVAALAGGIAAAVAGSSMMATVPAGIPTPEEASAQDTGAILVPVGIGAAAVGGALVAWDLANLFTSGTSTRVVSTNKRTRTTEERICDRAPAGGFALDLRSGDRSTRLTTDSAGKAQISAVTAPLKDWAFQRPFLTVAGTKVELAAEPAAKLAMEHRSEKELKLWLATFPNVGAPLRTEVEALLTTTSEEGRKLAEADAVRQAAELNKSARAAFQAGDFGDASNKASECLSLIPEHPQCKDIAARADREWEKRRQRRQAEEEKQARIEAAASAKEEAAERRRQEAERKERVRTGRCTPEENADLQRALAQMKPIMQGSDLFYSAHAIGFAGSAPWSGRTGISGDYHVFAIGYSELALDVRGRDGQPAALPSLYVRVAQVASGGGVVTSKVLQANAFEPFTVRITGDGCALMAIFRAR